MMKASSRTVRKGKAKFALVVDGQCESWYFHMLKRNEKGVAVDLKPEIAAKKKLEDQFRQVMSLAQDYDRVFWIIDLDVVLEETRKAKKGIKTAMQVLQHCCAKVSGHKRVRVIINDPCFEHWLLMHFKNTSKSFTGCNAAEKELGKYLKGYEKTQLFYTKQDHDIWLKLRALLPEAIARVQKTKMTHPTLSGLAVGKMDALFKELNLP